MESRHHWTAAAKKGACLVGHLSTKFNENSDRSQREESGKAKKESVPDIHSIGTGKIDEAFIQLC